MKKSNTVKILTYVERTKVFGEINGNLNNA